MLIEIRNYHFDPAKFAAYKAWAIEEAVPFLKANLDIAGFWLATQDPMELSGAEPMELRLGAANVTWMIRWESREARAEGHRRVFGSEGWRDIWSRHPDPNAYLQMEAHLAEEV